MWRSSSTAGSTHVETDWQIAATKRRGNIAQNGGAYMGEPELANQQQRQLGKRYGAKSDH